MVPIVGYGASVVKIARNTLKLSEGVFHSVQGVRYARRFYASVDKVESALTHIYRHGADDLSKNYHSFFNSIDDMIGLIDDAYLKITNLSTDVVKVTETRKKLSYIVDMKKVVGTEGGKFGSGDDLTHILVVLDKITGDIINSYPIKYP